MNNTRFNKRVASLFEVHFWISMFNLCF